MVYIAVVAALLALTGCKSPSPQGIQGGQTFAPAGGSDGSGGGGGGGMGM